MITPLPMGVGFVVDSTLFELGCLRAIVRDDEIFTHLWGVVRRMFPAGVEYPGPPKSGLVPHAVP